MKILVIRLLGLGDIANILIPAVRMIKEEDPLSSVDALVFGSGVELAELCPEIDNVLGVEKAQWPNDPLSAIASFSSIALFLIQRNYDKIICIDTWFMPCYLATFLREAGQNVQGNFISQSTEAVSQDIINGKADPDYFKSTNFLVSSFNNMNDWKGKWWESNHDYDHYALFYLQHCCSFKGAYDLSLNVSVDEELEAIANKQKVVAVNYSGSGKNKEYLDHQKLIDSLRDTGFHVWSSFDGSQSMLKTLEMLKASHLLITVATSSQWLAKAVGTPSLILPGSVPPVVLGAEFFVERHLDCQFCLQIECVANKDYECMKIPYPKIVQLAKEILSDIPKN